MKYRSLELLGETPVILASKSPRRSDIMHSMGFRGFEIIVSDADETVADGTPVERAVEELAIRKLRATVEASGDRRDTLYVAADTIVECDGEALGKPHDEADAVRMILSLSNRAHRVYTGEAAYINGRLLSGAAYTEVVMREITPDEAREYVATGEPMDKAGAYAIQGEAGKFVSGTRGDLDTVIGLSSRLLDSLISRLLDPAASDIAAFAELLSRRYPVAECALKYGGEPWRLLVLAILSAQCTDEKVNRTSPALFAKYPSPADLAEAEISDVEEILHPLGLFRAKAKNIVASARLLCEEYGGALPSEMDDLLRFPGVGRKVANLLRGDIFGLGGIVADTHCIRICGRIGAYSEDRRDPLLTERVISPLLPEEAQSDFCHRVVLFGREVCTARSPACDSCEMRAAGICAHARRV